MTINVLPLRRSAAPRPIPAATVEALGYSRADLPALLAEVRKAAARLVKGGVA